MKFKTMTLNIEKTGEPFVREDGVKVTAHYGRRPNGRRIYVTFKMEKDGRTMFTEPVSTGF